MAEENREWGYIQGFGPARAIAITAQLVAATEIHWSSPCGKPPLSKYGCTGSARRFVVVRDVLQIQSTKANRRRPLRHSIIPPEVS
jgi:hypothetical protein